MRCNCTALYYKVESKYTNLFTEIGRLILTEADCPSILNYCRCQCTGSCNTEQHILKTPTNHDLPESVYYGLWFAHFAFPDKPFL